MPLSPTIKFDFYLTFKANGSVRVTKGYPGQLSRDERAMRMNADIPRGLFTTPELRATIVVPEPQSEPIQIDIQAASAALRAVIGTDIDLRVVSPPALESQTP
jgi:hypothetical protein